MSSRYYVRSLEMKRTRYITVVIACAALVVGCKKDQKKIVRLATTTSIENSGLLAVLVGPFRKKAGIDVQVMPMGTGKALRTARDGNCDVVLTHAPQAEEQFVSEGWGVGRTQVMYSDFVIAGPAADPAQIKGMKWPADAVKKIAAARNAFVSRGDNSGTHAKEMGLWRAAGLEPAGDWYRSVGKGMGDALTMADEMRAYVLVDRGTFIGFRSKIDLVVLVEGDKSLYNPYSVIAVNPARHPHTKYDEAMKFIEFLTSDEGRKLIGNYKLDGETLFHPWPKESKPPATTQGSGSS